MKITKLKVNGEDAVVANSALEGQLLPVPEEGDAGKVPTVQEDGSYTLSNVGGSNAPLICTDTEGTLDKTMGEILESVNAGKIIYIGFNEYDNTEDSGLYMVSHIVPVHLGLIDYVGDIELIYFDGVNFARSMYSAHGQTEEEALAAYPTLIIGDK